MVKILQRQPTQSIEIVYGDPEHPLRPWIVDEIGWMTSVVCASQ